MAALSELVAEDREEDVELLKVAVLRTGLHVQFHFVSNGTEAIDYLKGVKRRHRKIFRRPANLER